MRVRQERQAHIPDDRLVVPADSDARHAIGSNRAEMIATLMNRIGAVRRRQSEAGSWVIDEEPLDEG